MIVCTIVLIVFILFTLRQFTIGRFLFAALSAIVSVVLFAVLTVLRRQLRIMKIMNSKDFD